MAEATAVVTEVVTAEATGAVPTVAIIKEEDMEVVMAEATVEAEIGTMVVEVVDVAEVEAEDVAEVVGEDAVGVEEEVVEEVAFAINFRLENVLTATNASSDMDRRFGCNFSYFTFFGINRNNITMPVVTNTHLF